MQKSLKSVSLTQETQYRIQKSLKSVFLTLETVPDTEVVEIRFPHSGYSVPDAEVAEMGFPHSGDSVPDAEVAEIGFPHSGDSVPKLAYSVLRVECSILELGASYRRLSPGDWKPFFNVFCNPFISTSTKVSISQILFSSVNFCIIYRGLLRVKHSVVVSCFYMPLL
jgi:hypothetical protein